MPASEGNEVFIGLFDSPEPLAQPSDGLFLERNDLAHAPWLPESG